MTDFEKFSTIRAVFLDMDGTIYHGSRLYPTTMPFIHFLEERKIPYAYCSNNTSYSKKEYVARLEKFGLEATEKNFYTATDFLIDTLKKEHPEWKKVYLLGMPAMAEELTAAGFEIVDDDPEAVIVSFDKLLVYERLCKAAYFIREGVPGFSSHPDFFCPSDQPTCLVDCGAISRCVELASGRELRQLGKPAAGFLQSAAARLKLDASQTLMIGDRLATDIAAGTNAGSFTCRIVGPGADLASFAPVTPDWVCNDLGELQKLWESAK